MQPYPEYSIQIETTNGKDFSQDKGFTDLTCKIQGLDIPKDKITYHWSEESHAKADVVENNLSKTPLVEGMLNAEIQERVGQFVKKYLSSNESRGFN